MEITLKNLFDWIIKGIAFILIVSFLFGAAFFAATKYFVEPTYRTSVKFYASGGNSNVQMINNYRAWAPQYIEFLNVSEFYEKVSKDLFSDKGVEISPGAIAGYLSFSSIIEETSSFFVRVTTTDPTLTYNIALSVAKMAPQQIEDFQDTGSLEVLSYPTMPTSPVGPNASRNALLGFMIGFVLSAFLVILRELLDNRIKTAEEITEIFHLPVFGVVPDFGTSETKGAN